MTKHYIYVDSRERNTNEDVNDFTVHLHQPIHNVKRAGLVSFSKGNNSHNVHDGNNTIKWREIRFSNGVYESTQDFFQITLTSGYYGINQLLTEITTKMTDTTGRLFQSETPTTYTYSIDDDYRVSIIGTSANSAIANRYWAFYVPQNESFNNSILHSVLNFQKDDVVYDVTVDPDNAPIEAAWRQSNSSLATTARTLKSRFSYTENQSVLHLASNTLSQNTQRMLMRNDHSETVKTNILEVIQVIVNRWSYIHLNKNSNDIQYHDMHNRTISHFDVKLLGEHLDKLHTTAESDFKAVFVFETVDQSSAEITEMYKEYNASAYRQAHRVR